jgi:hypothetical protein
MNKLKFSFTKKKRKKITNHCVCRIEESTETDRDNEESEIKQRWC